MAERKAKTMDRQEELVRLLAIQVRRGSGSQTETVVEMTRAGFGPTRIAELLGTTPNTVNQALQDAKKQKTRKGRASAKAEAKPS